jgi:hypothetical protein
MKTKINGKTVKRNGSSEERNWDQREDMKWSWRGMFMSG